jgi:hypothetical protein
MSDEDLQAIIRELLLAMNRLHETSSAVLLVLKERGVTDQEGFQKAKQWVAEANRERREAIEKLRVDSTIEFLKGFEGPIQ